MLGWRLGSQKKQLYDTNNTSLIYKIAAEINHQNEFPKMSSLRATELYNDGNICTLSSDLVHLTDRKKFDSYPKQFIASPMQADERLVAFTLVQSSSVKRILEIGGLQGNSAYNWLQLLKCKTVDGATTTVYTVDIKSVPKHDDHVVQHKTIIKTP